MLPHPQGSLCVKLEINVKNERSWWRIRKVCLAFLEGLGLGTAVVYVGGSTRRNACCPLLGQDLRHVSTRNPAPAAKARLLLCPSLPLRRSLSFLFFPSPWQWI